MHHLATFVLAVAASASAAGGNNTSIELAVAGVGALAALLSAIAGLISVLGRRHSGDRIVIVTPEQAEQMHLADEKPSPRGRRRPR